MRQWLVDGGFLDLVTLHPLVSGLVVLAFLFSLRMALRRR